MPKLTPELIKQFIGEVNDSSEETRRAEILKRHRIYQDGGKEFLIEQMRREFGEDSLKEMRIAPINILRKIINKRSSLYKTSPQRQPLVESQTDQALIDYYVKELKLNEVMQKANRYFNLDANTVLYTIPVDGKLRACVVPSYLYSVGPNPINKQRIDIWAFNSFVESSRITPMDDLPSATGEESYSKDAGYTTGGQDLVASNERKSDTSRYFMFWGYGQHITTDENGSILFDPTKDDTQFINPIGIDPVVNITKERDNEPWAKQGQDLIDMCIALQLGWSDLLTIAKHQGFSLLTVVSEDEPKQLNIGINRAVWLRRKPGGDAPTISYVQASSPLAEYKDLLMDLLGLTLTSNDMNPGTVTGRVQPDNAASGFSQLIQMADTLEARENDKPVLKCAEEYHFEVIKRWHNWMFDNNALEEEARALGKFSDEFKLSITFAEAKPIESEADRLDIVERRLKINMITQPDAWRLLDPDLTDKQIAQKIAEVSAGRQAAMQSIFGTQPQTPPQAPEQTPAQEAVIEEKTSMSPLDITEEYGASAS